MCKLFSVLYIVFIIFTFGLRVNKLLLFTVKLDNACLMIIRHAFFIRHYLMMYNRSEIKAFHVGRV